jgi:hypothetical protein
VAVIERVGWPEFTYDQLEDGLREDLGVPPEMLVATGVRAADSMTRRANIRRNGPLIASKKKVHCIWDWGASHVNSAIKEAGVKLPVDYWLFGRSLDGLQLDFIEPIKRHYPEDYAKILEWFPLAELELYRRTLDERIEG